MTTSEQKQSLDWHFNFYLNGYQNKQSNCNNLSTSCQRFPRSSSTACTTFDWLEAWILQKILRTLYNCTCNDPQHPHICPSYTFSVLKMPSHILAKEKYWCLWIYSNLLILSLPSDGTTENEDWLCTLMAYLRMLASYLPRRLLNVDCKMLNAIPYFSGNMICNRS